RTARALEKMVEERVHAVRRHRKLSPRVDTELPQRTKHPAHDAALEQSAVVTEHEVKGALDRHAQPAVGRDSVVDGLDVPLDLNGGRVGFIAVVAEKEHEWLCEPFLNDAAVRSA